METIIFLDYLKQNVLSNYGKAYTIDMTFTRGSPEAATLLAPARPTSPCWHPGRLPRRPTRARWLAA